MSGKPYGRDEPTCPICGHDVDPPNPGTTLRFCPTCDTLLKKIVPFIYIDEPGWYWKIVSDDDIDVEVLRDNMPR